MPGVAFAPTPYCYRCPLGFDDPETCGLACAERVREIVRLHLSGAACAFVAEPVMGEGGIIVPPDGYFKAVKKILDDEGMLFIADEVQSGFSRTGKLFAIDQVSAFELQLDLRVLNLKVYWKDDPLRGIGTSNSLKRMAVL